MGTVFEIGKQINLRDVRAAAASPDDEHVVLRQGGVTAVAFTADALEHYYPMPECGAHLLTRDDAAAVANATDPLQPLRAEKRTNAYGRRIDDGHGAGWGVAVIAALFAVAAVAVPDHWKLDPPHLAAATAAECRP